MCGRVEGAFERFDFASQVEESCLEREIVVLKARDVFLGRLGCSRAESRLESCFALDIEPELKPRRFGRKEFVARALPEAPEAVFKRDATREFGEQPIAHAREFGLEPRVLFRRNESRVGCFGEMIFKPCERLKETPRVVARFVKFRT